MKSLPAFWKTKIGSEGIKAARGAKTWEEAGVRLSEADIEPLGAPIFPSPGMSPSVPFGLCRSQRKRKVSRRRRFPMERRQAIVAVAFRSACAVSAWGSGRRED